MASRTRHRGEGPILTWLAQLEAEQLWRDLAPEARRDLVRELARLMVRSVVRRTSDEGGGERDSDHAP